MGNPVPEHLTHAEAWENTLRLTFAMPSQTYKLSPEAFAAFRKFQEWYEDRMRSERLLNSSPEFVMAFGKITGLCGRLILMFHAIEAPFSPTVDVGIVERVVRILREYVVPVYRRVFDAEGSMTAFDMWVVEYVIQHADENSLTLSDLKRSARRQFEKAGLIKQNWQMNEWTIGAMYLLEKTGWVARVDDGSQESRGTAEWLINPHLKTTFREYREAVVKAKLALAEDRFEKAKIEHNRPLVHGMDVIDSGERV